MYDEIGDLLQKEYVGQSSPDDPVFDLVRQTYRDRWAELAVNKKYPSLSSYLRAHPFVENARCVRPRTLAASFALHSD
jgi:hypothetical protein